MKKFYFLTLLLALFSLPAMAQVAVTFQVDMNEAALTGPVNAHIAGSHQAAAGQATDWTPENGPMQDNNGDGIWRVTYSLPDGASYEYKFLTGSGWGSDESDNRSITIADSGDGTMEVPLVCFNSSMACANTSVTLRVDLNDETVAGNFDPSVDGVSAAGTIPGISWTPEENPMSDDDGDNVWEITLDNVDENLYQYKFVIVKEDASLVWESNVGDCEGSADGNRGASFAANTTRPTVCFNKCGDCELTAAPEKYQVTFQVDMSNMLAQFDALDTVYAAGSFQGWTPGAFAMVDDGTLGDMTAGDGIFTGQDSLIDGAYQFKYIYGDDWGFDETGLGTLPCGMDNGGNREFTVAGGDLTLDAECFNACGVGCPTLADAVNVTFLLDLSQEIPNAEGVFIKGSFQWPQFEDNVTEMTTGGGGIYSSGPITLRPGEITFQFSNGPTGEDNENAAFTDLGCGSTNPVGTQLRLIDLTGLTQDTTIGYVWNQCQDFVSSTTAISTIQNFKVSPNPFTNQTVLEFDNLNNAIHHLTITNLTGQTVKVMNNIRDNKVVITRDNMPTGVYFASLRNEKGEVITQKIIAH